MSRSQATDVFYYAHSNLGYALNQLGEFVEGERCCCLAQHIDPARPNANRNIALALQGRGRYADAARAFITGTLKVPHDARALVFLEEMLAEHPEVRAELPTIDDDLAQCHAAVRATGH